MNYLDIFNSDILETILEKAVDNLESSIIKLEKNILLTEVKLKPLTICKEYNEESESEYTIEYGGFLSTVNYSLESYLFNSLDYEKICIIRWINDDSGSLDPDNDNDDEIILSSVKEKPTYLDYLILHAELFNPDIYERDNDFRCLTEKPQVLKESELESVKDILEARQGNYYLDNTITYLLFYLE